MDNLEKLVTMGKQDTERRQTKQGASKNGQSRERWVNKTEGASKNGQSRETGNHGWTRHRTKTNKTRGKQEWTI